MVSQSYYFKKKNCKIFLTFKTKDSKIKTSQILDNECNLRELLVDWSLKNWTENEK